MNRAVDHAEGTVLNNKLLFVHKPEFLILCCFFSFVVVFATPVCTVLFQQLFDGSLVNCVS